MKSSWFKKIAITLSLGALPCTLLSAAHAADHTPGTRILFSVESDETS